MTCNKSAMAEEEWEDEFEKEPLSNGKKSNLEDEVLSDNPDKETHL